MTKEVLLAIKGLQFSENDEESSIETVMAAEYYKKNNSHYVIFEETSEGFEQTTRNIIKFKEKALDLTKRGLINVHMVFEENQKNMTNYSTPFGDILIGIDAKRVSMQEEDSRIKVNVDYALEVNYEYLADCKLTMDIQAKDEHFSLMED